MDYLSWRNTAIGKIQLLMVDALFNEIGSFISFIIEPDNGGNSQFFEDRNIVIGRITAVLRYSSITPYLSVLLSEGELKATNLLGMIQFKSPF